MQQRALKSYLFYGQTQSLCETCLHPVPTKILIEDERVYFQKRCEAHGVQKTLVSTDAAYYRQCRDWLKPGDIPLKFQSRTHYGCPFDCGLCPDHEQHSCLALIEVNEHCNLTCPVCFADSAPHRPKHLDLDTIARMMDTLVISEGEPDLLQISGGEPTLHPDILTILRMAKQGLFMELRSALTEAKAAKGPIVREGLHRLAAMDISGQTLTNA